MADDQAQIAQAKEMLEKLSKEAEETKANPTSPTFCRQPIGEYFHLKITMVNQAPMLVSLTVQRRISYA